MCNGKTNFLSSGPSPSLPPPRAMHEQMDFYTSRVLYNRVAHRCCRRRRRVKEAFQSVREHVTWEKQRGLFVYFSRNIKYRVEHVARWKRLIDQWKQNRKRFCLRATVPLPICPQQICPSSPLPLERSSIKRRAGHTRPRATSAIFQRPATRMLSNHWLSTWIESCNRAHPHQRSFDAARFIVSRQNSTSMSEGLLVVRFLNERGFLRLKTFPFEAKLEGIIHPRFRFPSIDQRMVGRKDGWDEDIFRSNRRVFRNRSFWHWLTNSFGGLVGVLCRGWRRRKKEEEEGSEGMNSYRDGRQFLVRKKAVKSDGILLDIRNRS